MNLDLPTFARYLRVLQAQGQSHLILSKGALQTLRNAVSKTAPASVSASRNISTANVSLVTRETAREVPVTNRVIEPILAPKITIAPASAIRGVDLQQIDLESGTPAERMERLAIAARQCQHCAHLASSRRSVVFGSGNPEAKLMFVGEAPGPEEDEVGEPFVGTAGQLLTKMIEAMGMKREEIYIANVLKCRPDLPEGSIGNRKPTTQEMGSCLPFLEKQIKIVQPKILVALGATAVEGLLHEKTPIGKLRGNWMNFQGIPLIPTYHPTYLLRNQSIVEKRKVWEDLLKVMEALKLPISEKQRGYFLSKAS